jgi:hypothetical protein
MLSDAEKDDEVTLKVIITGAFLDAHGVTALVGINVVHARCAARAPR